MGTAIQTTSPMSDHVRIWWWCGKLRNCSPKEDKGPLPGPIASKVDSIGKRPSQATGLVSVVSRVDLLDLIRPYLPMDVFVGRICMTEEAA
jgi:hypothetical protein